MRTRWISSFWLQVVRMGALPCPAWVEYKKRTGKLITDSLAKEIAGHFLKTALESGEGLGREMYTLTVDETLQHLEGVVAELKGGSGYALACGADEKIRILVSL